MKQFLIHEIADNVGVAVVDIQAGQTVTGGGLNNGQRVQLTAREEIPLGHKIALQDLAAGSTVIKYGEDIGKVVASIRAGEHVHVHNLKTKRW
jgi:(2R)-sulfolactate sulfo-lyase subunit alpha